MQRTVTGGTPRVVGIVGDGRSTASAAFTLHAAKALAACGVRVLAGAIDRGRQAAIGAACATTADERIACLDLRLDGAAATEDPRALCGAIEDAGRSFERIVLDLGPIESPAATFFGAAVDDLVLLLDATTDVGLAAGYVGTLARVWARDEIQVVVLGAADAESALAPLRALTSATTAASPRLVPLGAMSPLPALDLGSVDAGTFTMDEIAPIVAPLLAPRPMGLRGGLQFFLEDRAAHRRAE